MKKTRKLVILLALALTMITPSVLPVVGSSIIVEAATIKISKKLLTLEVGKTSTLRISGTKKKVAWTSSKKTVATVSTKGSVTAKAKGATTITATIDGKKYTCKVTVKVAPNKYLKDAPFDAVEKKIGDVSIVIPKGWVYEAQELSPEVVVAGFAPNKSSKSAIYFKKIKTGKKAPDYSLTKEYFHDLITQELIQQQLEVAYNTSDFKISNFTSSDFTSNLNTAYKTEFEVTLSGSLRKQSIYDIYTDNYLFEITLEDADQLDLDTIAQYVLNSIVLTK